LKPRATENGRGSVGADPQQISAVSSKNLFLSRKIRL